MLAIWIATGAAALFGLATVLGRRLKQPPFSCDCTATAGDQCAACRNGAHHLCGQGCSRSGWKLPAELPR